MTAGCQQQMARQPSYRPLQPSAFFADGRSARPLVDGTVPRGELHADPHFYEGKRVAAGGAASQAASLVGAPLVGTALGTALHELASYADTLPFPASQLQDRWRRGQERFNIFCAVCHDRAGSGKGMIVRRGFTQPPSLPMDLSRSFKLRGLKLPLRDAPVGYIYHVITAGYGAMPAHGPQIPPADRWAIVAYVRALQFSQHARLADIRDPEVKQRLLATRARETVKEGQR